MGYFFSGKFLQFSCFIITRFDELMIRFYFSSYFTDRIFTRCMTIPVREVMPRAVTYKKPISYGVLSMYRLYAIAEAYVERAKYLESLAGETHVVSFQSLGIKFLHASASTREEGETKCETLQRSRDAGNVQARVESIIEIQTVPLSRLMCLNFYVSVKIFLHACYSCERKCSCTR